MSELRFLLLQKTHVRKDLLPIVEDLLYFISRTFATFAHEREPLINNKSGSGWKVEYNMKINPLSANPTKWSNTQRICRQKRLRNHKINLPNLQITYNWIVSKFFDQLIENIQWSIKRFTVLFFVLTLFFCEAWTKLLQVMFLMSLCVNMYGYPLQQL